MYKVLGQDLASICQLALPAPRVGPAGGYTRGADQIAMLQRSPSQTFDIWVTIIVGPLSRIAEFMMFMELLEVAFPCREALELDINGVSTPALPGFDEKGKCEKYEEVWRNQITG